MKNPALYASAAVFTLVSLAHFVRFFRADEILISGYPIPVFWSLIAAIIILAMAVWMVAAVKR